MAQTVSGFYGTVEAPAEAGRFHRLAPPRVERAGMFPATPSATRVITLGAGTLLCCGIRFTESASAAVTLASVASGIRYDVVGYRFTWNATGGTVALFTKAGTSTALPVLDRRPGIVYEMPLVLVTVRAGVTTVSSADIADMRVLGGFGGGAFTINNTTGVNGLDLPQGSYLKVGNATYQAWTVSGTGQTSMLLIATSSGPWLPFTPTLRANGTPVNMGVSTGQILQGRYQIQDGTCRVRAQIVHGNSGQSFGNGQFSIDLPAMPTNLITDQWGDGRLYTVNGGNMNWFIKGLIRRDMGQRAYLYAPTAGDDVRMLPEGSSISPSPGLGIPYLAGFYSEPRAIVFNAEYLI